MPVNHPRRLRFEGRVQPCEGLVLGGADLVGIPKAIVGVRFSGPGMRQTRYQHPGPQPQYRHICCLFCWHSSQRCFLCHHQLRCHPHRRNTRWYLRQPRPNERRKGAACEGATAQNSDATTAQLKRPDPGLGQSQSPSPHAKSGCRDGRRGRPIDCHASSGTPHARAVPPPLFAAPPTSPQRMACTLPS